jgi:hypothetical protein
MNGYNIVSELFGRAKKDKEKSRQTVRGYIKSNLAVWHNVGKVVYKAHYGKDHVQPMLAKVVNDLTKKIILANRETLTSIRNPSKHISGWVHYYLEHYFFAAYEKKSIPPAKEILD